MRALVVGGGLAGAAAALELAERGAEVRLLRAAPGATALSWGTLDVAGAAPLPGGLPVRDPLRGEWLAPAARAVLLARRPAHPYGRLLPPEPTESAATALAKEATGALDGWLAPQGLRVMGSPESTLWIADVRGALRAGDFALTGTAEGALDDAAELAWVEMPGLAGWDARPAARAFAAERAALNLPARSHRVVRLELPPALLEPGGSPARLAARLETPDGLEVLRRALAPLGAEGRLLLLPPVLGLGGVARVLAALRESAGCRVGELAGAPPHAVAGLRLDRALAGALAASGVEQRGALVRAVVEQAGRAIGVELQGEEGATERLEAEAVVLATGRFVAGGLVERDGALAEPLLDLPLHDASGQRVDGTPARRLVVRAYTASQPLYEAGVRTDRRLRPLGADGRARLPNLFAAGDLIGGTDPAHDRSGLGVALVTGRAAGAEAFESLAESGARA